MLVEGSTVVTTAAPSMWTTDGAPKLPPFRRSAQLPAGFESGPTLHHCNCGCVRAMGTAPGFAGFATLMA